MTGRLAIAVGLVGALGWIGLIWLGVTLYRTDPPTAGFDLELLLRAGRAVAAGRSPYDAAIVAGAAPVAERLFYSYPPVVAQAMSLVAGIPSAAVLVLWDATAVAGLALVSGGLVRRFAPTLSASSVAWLVAALVPLMFPLAIGLLFGNLDVFFPLLYGLMLLAMAEPSASADAAQGGVATAVAGLTKLHPGSMGLWFLVRAPASRVARAVVVTAIVAALVILAISVLVGGTQPWLDYLAVVRAGSGADLVDPRNAGPAAQLALVVGGGGESAETLARNLQILVTLAALAVMAVASRALRDPVESLTWAAAASLVILPVTWYHYPSALIPFALAALLRSRASPQARTTQLLIVASAFIAAIAIAWLPLLYVAVGLLLAGVRVSQRARAA